MTKYVKYPMPFEAWKNFKEKQANMNSTYKEMTGKNRNIPLSKIILAISKRPMYFDHKEVIFKLSKRRNK